MVSSTIPTGRTRGWFHLSYHLCLDFFFWESKVEGQITSFSLLKGSNFHNPKQTPLFLVKQHLARPTPYLLFPNLKLHSFVERKSSRESLWLSGLESFRRPQSFPLVVRSFSYCGKEYWSKAQRILQPIPLSTEWADFAPHPLLHLSRASLSGCERLEEGRR